MSNYDDVFKVIKKQCNNTNNFESEQCYADLVSLLQNRVCLPVTFYLDSLEHLGIITHQKDTNKIILTKKGMTTNTLFM